MQNAEIWHSQFSMPCRYILVDECQDIDDLQYFLVSALAWRKAEEEGRLCILAVGGDDPNIYSWRDATIAKLNAFEKTTRPPTPI